MGQHTDIQWCDSTINPTTGCDGCELWIPGKGGVCYAGNFHTRRLANSLPQLYAKDFTEVRLALGRMVKAAAWSDLRGIDRHDKPWFNGFPRIIFISDMADAMSAAVPFEYLKSEIIDNVTSPNGQRHVWMWLTKQPKRMKEFSAWLREQGIFWPENLWAGTSITRQATCSRIDHLERVGDVTTTRFVSAEPLYERVDLHKWLARGNIDLVIIGGMSRQGGHPHTRCDLQWISDILRECHHACVCPFIKQLGANPYMSYAVAGEGVRTEDVPVKDSHGGDWNEWPAWARVRRFPPVLSAVTA
jgi:protein gp37